MHSTNYSNAFIAVAEDCPTEVGTPPPEKAAPTIARLQFEMIRDNPYRYTSDDVVFTVHLIRNQIHPAEAAARRAEFFSKGQACLRASPLGKRYGWGIHHDANARVALYARESEEYRRLSEDARLQQVKAMRSAR